MDVQAVEGRAEAKRFDQMLDSEHWLGSGSPAGQYLRQVVVREGRWVGLLAWGPAARRLKERDRFIGWDAAKRSERLKLIVQNLFSAPRRAAAN